MNRDLIKTLLILGRVSNLPTVWSNCLAAWMLTAGLQKDASQWQLFLLLIVGISLLYLAGMFLNDACDVAFDKVHRSERPIPSHRVSRLTVTILGVLWMLGGLGLLLAVGKWWAAALAVLILLYDIVHKKTVLGLPMMAGCRALIYPMVGAAVGLSWHAFPFMLWLASGGMALWVLFLSILARNNGRLSAAVPNLLAAIPLLDLLFVSPQPIVNCLPFLGFTLLAVVLRRSIPPT